MRLTTRVPSQLRVDWNILGRRAHVVSCLENMSAGGAYVRTPIPVPEGTQIQMQLLTDGGIVPMLARVVRCEPSGMAVRFDLDSEFDAPFEVSLDDFDMD